MPTMTTIFTFADEISVKAESQKEATQERLNYLEDLDEAEEKEDFLETLKETINQERVPDFEDLDSQYHVVKHDPKTTVSGHDYLLETFGADEAMAKVSDPHHIWTILETDSGLDYICPGFHYVNRVGYLQTLKPWESDQLNFLW